jgi:hypothetical protein
MKILQHPPQIDFNISGRISFIHAFFLLIPGCPFFIINITTHYSFNDIVLVVRKKNRAFPFLFFRFAQCICGGNGTLKSFHSRTLQHHSIC